MNYPVFWLVIPEKTLDNFKHHCGCSSSRSFERFIEVMNIELKRFNAYWKDNHYVFESEAHYQWFLLRFS